MVSTTNFSSSGSDLSLPKEWVSQPSHILFDTWEDRHSPRTT